VAGQLEHARMEADVIPGPVEDDAFEIVVENRPGRAAEGGEGLDVAAEEALQRLAGRRLGDVQRSLAFRLARSLTSRSH